MVTGSFFVGQMEDSAGMLEHGAEWRDSECCRVNEYSASTVRLNKGSTPVVTLRRQFVLVGSGLRPMCLDCL